MPILPLLAETSVVAKTRTNQSLARAGVFAHPGPLPPDYPAKNHQLTVAASLRRITHGRTQARRASEGARTTYPRLRQSGLCSTYGGVVGGGMAAPPFQLGTLQATRAVDRMTGVDAARRPPFTSGRRGRLARLRDVGWALARLRDAAASRVSTGESITVVLLAHRVRPKRLRWRAKAHPTSVP